ncbi:MAG: nuclear transport factor 2 family protein [Desulfobacterales bacterium]|nr:nuclear transport factor 2 family protein [Desulfobacterales bacterium]
MVWAQKAITHTLTTTADTEPRDVLAVPTHFKGRDGLHVTVTPDHRSVEEGGKDNATFLLVDKTPFKNGTIRLKMAGQPAENAPEWARGFVGVVFRVNEDKSKYEGFYLRPVNATEKGDRRNFTFQYFSYPEYPWHRLRKEYPGKYEGYADVKPGEWMDLTVEVNGAEATFSVNGKQVLTVDRLFHGDNLSGGVGLFTEPETDAYFSSLELTFTEIAKTPKQVVTEFYNQAFVRGDLESAAEAYVSDQKYIQHNPSAPDGRAHLIEKLAPMLKKINYTCSIKRVIAEGDLVMVHSHGTYTTDKPAPQHEAVVDIFRVLDGKIVEHWDVIQPVPEKAANSNTMF